MAISEVIFRLPWGYISDLKGMNRHYILGFVMIFLGLSLVAIAWSTSYVMLACICGFSGIFQVLYYMTVDIILYVIIHPAAYASALGDYIS